MSYGPHADVARTCPVWPDEMSEQARDATLAAMMRDAASKIAQINRTYGLPPNAPMHESWLRHEADRLENGKW